MTLPRSEQPLRPRFRAVITPSRSLGKTGFIVLMAAVFLVSFSAGLYFYAIGAWPVMGFFGLDVVLLYVAFRLNYRDGRACEIVELDEDGLVLERFVPSGEKRGSFRFNPHWVRLELAERPSGESVLTLSSHGQAVSVARDLSDHERRAFATALAGAIAGWCRGRA